MRGSYWFNRDKPKPAKPELKDLVSAANEVAKTARDVLTAMLVVALTLAATMIAATDEALLRDSAEVFPGLGVKVRLSTVFLLAPIVFVFLHANALLQLHLLAGRIRGLNAQMEAQGLDETARRSWRRMIHGFAFAQLLAGEDGHGGVGEKAHRVLLAVMSWLAITAVPVVLLVCTQVSFVRYQSDPITLAHQIVLGADLTLLLWFHFAHWGRVVRWRWVSVLWSASALAGTGGLVWLSLTQALPPGPEVDKLGGSVFDQTCWWSGLAWSCRYLDLSGRTLVNNDARPELLKPFADSDAASKVHQRKMVALDLHGRTLRFANFSGAQLFSANLREIKAERSRWYGAILDGAYLSDASLQGATLTSASLQGATLYLTSLRGANLSSASLQGANLTSASFQGANLSWASLQGATLTSASLQGANLTSASLQGANLLSASFQGADLSSASLQGANLLSASFQGADLSSASLQGANLLSASFQGADLSSASLQGAYSAEASFQGASLDGTNIAGALISGEGYRRLATGRMKGCGQAGLLSGTVAPYDRAMLKADLTTAGLPRTSIDAILQRIDQEKPAACAEGALTSGGIWRADWAKAWVAAACSHPAAAQRILANLFSDHDVVRAAWKAETCPVVMAIKRERGEVK